MAGLDSLTSEILGTIAEHCIANARAAEKAALSDVSSLARTNHTVHNLVNPILYKLNLTHRAPRDSCMLWAAEHGRLDTIKTALSYGADIDANGAASPDHVRRPWSQQTHVIATPLHIALNYNDVDIVEFLLDKGANPHVPSVNLCACRGDYGAPYALHTALAHSKLEGAAAMLIQRAGAYLLAEKRPVLEMERSIHDKLRPALVDRLVEMPGPVPSAAALRYAIGLKQPELASRILARPEFDASLVSRLGETLIHCAVGHGDVATLKLLLARPDVDAGAGDQHGTTPLHIIAKQGHDQFVREFVGRGDVNVNAATDRGRTPIQEAAGARKWAVMRELLSSPGIDANGGRSPYYVPLNEAIKDDNNELVRQLLARSDVDPLTRDANSNTALHDAARRDDVTTVKALLGRQGIFANAGKGSLGQTVLLCAADAAEGLAVLPLLLDGHYEIDVSSTDAAGYTALHLLARKRSGNSLLGQQLAKTLIDRGANIDDSSPGSTPFLEALTAANLDIAAALLSFGADPLWKSDMMNDQYYHCWMRIALQAPCQPQQVHLLREYLARGGDPNAYDFPSTDMFGTNQVQDCEVATAVPLLFMAASVAKNTACMRILLNAGADATMPVLLDHVCSREDAEVQAAAGWGDEDDDEGGGGNMSEDLCLGGRQAVLGAVVDHEEEYWMGEGAEWRGDEGGLDAPSARVALLLERGARLDFKDTTPSPLEYACRLAGEGYPGLLRLLLSKATAKNASIEHVREVRASMQDQAMAEQLDALIAKTYAEG